MLCPRLPLFWRCQSKDETGLLTGAIFVIVGLLISIFAVGYWRAAAFGPLDPGKTLRLVMPGVVFLTLGFQAIFSSFFLSLLGDGQTWIGGFEAASLCPIFWCAIMYSNMYNVCVERGTYGTG